MPYFKWYGVDITGSWKKGTQSAHSFEQLKSMLIERGVAVTRAKSTKKPVRSLFINDYEKSELFAHIAKLLRAGILLPNALEIAAQQCTNPRLHDMLWQMSVDIKSGKSFARSLKRHKKLCDTIVTNMLIAGHESGNLITSFENAARYCATRHDFKKNIRASLAMPLLTFLFFIGISSFIFTIIIPRFADMFTSFGQELPALTSTMIGISEFMRSRSFLYSFIVGFCFFAGGMYYFKTAGKQFYDSLIFRFPFIGQLFFYHTIGHVLQTLALLINSGIPLTKALYMVSESVGNHEMKKNLEQLHVDVDSGQLLSHAMQSCQLFLPEVVAMMCVGEESATLSTSLQNATHVYHDKMQSAMRRFIFFLQPMFIIFLGFLITSVILAVYLPIIELSRVV